MTALIALLLAAEVLGPPKAVTAQQQVIALKLTREAYKAVLKANEAANRERLHLSLCDDSQTRSEAIRAALRATSEKEAAKKELDEWNAKIDEWRKNVRELCKAPEEDWDINDSFEWVKRKK